MVGMVNAQVVGKGTECTRVGGESSWEYVGEQEWWVVGHNPDEGMLRTVWNG